ncbi:MAG: hypothetical protein Fur0018_16420 [Anaerolineales bacterium]
MAPKDPTLPDAHRSGFPNVRRALESWLDNDVPAPEELETLRQILNAAPDETPPPHLLLQLRKNVARTPQQRRLPRWFAFAWGAVLTLACLLVLWGIWRPSVTLQWQTSGNHDAWQSFQVYRAPLGTEDYHLIATLPVRVTRPQAVYSYTDRSALPGVDYAYRVEGLNDTGSVAVSQVMVYRGMDTLLQVGSLVLFSLSLGLLGVSLLPHGLPGHPREPQNEQVHTRR